MVISTKDDFESLSEHQKEKLRESWSYFADDFDVKEIADNYLNINYPEVQIKEIMAWEVDWGRCDIECRVWVDMPLTFDKYYHWLKANPTLQTPFFRRHYWMFMGLFTTRFFCYDSRSEEIDDYEDWSIVDGLSPDLKQFLDEFRDLAEENAKDWIYGLEKSVRESYEYITSDEYLIERLIANEVEVDSED